MHNNQFAFTTLDQLNLHDQRVLIRADFNVPMHHGKIINDARIKASLPTIELCLKAKARVILLSHLGRPKEGRYAEEFSLKPIAECLSRYLKRSVPLVPDWWQGLKVAKGEAVLCENVRFNVGEEANEAALAKQMAALGDLFVMDAFAVAHRAHASTVGIAQYAPRAVAGPLLMKELKALYQALQTPKRPLVAIVGGAKISDKLKLLKSLLTKVDTLMVAGGIANTFIAALGYSVGASLYEPDLISLAKELLPAGKLVVPIDGIVTKEIIASAKTRISNFSDIKIDEKIVDVGPKTSQHWEAILKEAKTIIWNGPVGIFEVKAFEAGTKQLATAIAASSAYSIAGGGETLAAIEHFKISDKISYISTGGAAFLAYLEGKPLPGVSILLHRNN